jgi:chemotaxis protein CheC
MSEGRMVVGTAEVRQLTPDDVLTSAGGSEVLVAAVYVGFSGPISGHGVLMLPLTDARILADTVLAGLTAADDGLPGFDDAGDLIPLQRSALEELGNVAVSAVLIRLGDEIGEPIHPSVPAFVVDMAGAVLDAIVSDVAGRSDTILAARTTFSQDGRHAQGVLLVVPSSADDGPLPSMPGSRL